MDLDDRMKAYEDITRNIIMPRMPVIMRLDGKAFHTLTRGCKKPFDQDIMDAMDTTALELVKQIQNARIAYVQSDEISILLIDYNKYESQQWFNGNINKMVSISSAIASVTFSKIFKKDAYFDSRAFVVPEREVANYFIWRQEDCTRNSIRMAAHSVFSEKQLHGASTSVAQEMLFQSGINWNDYSTREKRGAVATKDGLDYNIPIFTKNREFIETHLKVEQE